MENCVDECFYSVMSDTCGCKFPENCDTGKLTRDCISAYNSSTKLIMPGCRKKCLSACNLVEFSMKRFNNKLIVDKEDFDKYKNITSGKFNITGLTSDDIKSRLAKVYFYYDKLGTTEITQAPNMSGLDLIASIGGLIGRVL